ncbi:hypothetical protein BDP27DRAFT_1034895 [Rhodocollybia butyracea]|uniref:Uncharacterized protein n=1 Tax=Rhodocollybia butyracea TaxID=206335 RepID=A0A9P5Q7A4_9AGAR|nr:hypothetical protein BDP27DRAFT_1034895 [Rhodocollybia butyracea]
MLSTWAHEIQGLFLKLQTSAKGHTKMVINTTGTTVHTGFTLFQLAGQLNLASLSLEYVTMEVTRREQQEILRRRERGTSSSTDQYIISNTFDLCKDHSSKHHRRRTDSLLEIEQQRHLSMPIGSDDHHHEDRSSSGRDDTIRTTSGVNIFSYAQGGVIRGGRMSAVGRDQTIGGFRHTSS